MTNDAAIRNLTACVVLDWPVVGFVADSNYPNTTASNIFRDWLRYMLDGTLPPGVRVYCGVALPDFPLPSNQTD